MNNQTQRIYPFAAIVGQDRMKQGLILNVIHPRLSGILIRGKKGPLSQPPSGRWRNCCRKSRW